MIELHSVPKDTQENACLVKSNREDNIKKTKTKPRQTKNPQTNNVKVKILSAMWCFYKEK